MVGAKEKRFVKGRIKTSLKNHDSFFIEQHDEKLYVPDIVIKDKQKNIMIPVENQSECAIKLKKTDRIANIQPIVTLELKIENTPTYNELTMN